MTITRTFYITCDGIDDGSWCGNDADTAEYYRDVTIQLAKQDGWKVTSNGKATCPECLEKINERTARK